MTCVSIPKVSFLIGAVLLFTVSCTKASNEDFREYLDARLDQEELIRSEMYGNGIQAILGTGDLAVGRNRVGFVLISSTGFITEPSITLRSRFYEFEDTHGETVETSNALFQPWPYGNRGLYVTYMDFDRAGEWSIDIEIPPGNGTNQVIVLPIKVSEYTSAPPVGSKAIPSDTKTIASVRSLNELTTGSLHDEDLYQISIADAIVSGSPTVVVFASPAFCTNEVCGPQVEVLQKLKNVHQGKAHFIHVDLYENPHEMYGDLRNAKLSQSVLEWNLPSNEWTFVIDRAGVVSSRFEGFGTLSEVEEELLKVMQ